MTRVGTLIAAIPVCAALVTGCAAPRQTTTSVTKAPSPVDRAKLGHYSTADGEIGLVLDRSGERAKLRFDGAQDTVELVAKPGAYGRTDYADAGGYVFLNMWPDGRITAYHPSRPDGVPVKRDRDADAL
ncbi:MAG: hypothetical protein V2A73_06425 [Pseudomonadota bacterium]